MMSNFAKSEKKIAQQITAQNFKNLTIYAQHVNKLLAIQEEINKNYSQKLQGLQEQKKQLLALIRNSIASPSEKNVGNFQSPQKSHVKKQVLNINSQKQPDKNIRKETGNNTFKANKSLMKNQSGITINQKKKQQKQGKPNYLADQNGYKHRQLVQEVRKLAKQLQILTQKQTSNKNGSSIMMNQSTVVFDRSLMMQSRVFQSQKEKQQQLVGHSQEQKFILTNIASLGKIQRLPCSNVGEYPDEIVNGLIVNLQKQQATLIEKIAKFKQLQIQKVIKQHLQQKTIDNMRIIYKIKKQQQSKTQKTQVSNTKDLVRYGYTALMLQAIKQKYKNKAQFI